MSILLKQFVGVESPVCELSTVEYCNANFGDSWQEISINGIFYYEKLSSFNEFKLLRFSKSWRLLDIFMV